MGGRTGGTATSARAQEGRQRKQGAAAGESADAFFAYPQNLTIQISRRAQEKLERYFPGRFTTPSDLAAVAGARDGSQVKISYNDKGRKFEIDVMHPDVTDQVRTVKKIGDKIVLENDQLFLKEGLPRGTGTKIFAQQVQYAREMGVSHIQTYGARGPTMNGYYTWPRLGYNGEIKFRDVLPPSLKDAKDMHDLFSKPGGAAWWKENGVGQSFIFRLEKDSKSSQRLAKYLRENNIRGNA